VLPSAILRRQFRIIKAALDDLYGLTRGARDALWLAQLADGLITLDIIDEILDIDLHRWTPVRNHGMGCRQCIPSSHPTTLESNMSDDYFVRSYFLEKTVVRKSHHVLAWFVMMTLILVVS
jgi:hypothetical protein